MRIVRRLTIYVTITLAMLLEAVAVRGQGQVLNKLLMHDGITRRYTLYVPSTYKPQVHAPLVVNIHCYTLNRSFQMTYSGMNTVAEREGFLVAYPDAINSDWFGPQDNIGFIDRLLDDVSSEFSINDAKIYAAGLSQGGMMSYVLSVERPHRFAAIASVSGTRPFASSELLYPTTIDILPSRPFPLFHIHGTDDSLVPYSGGFSTVGAYSFDYPPVQELVEDYALNNGGDVTPTIVDLPDIITTDGTTVQKWIYGGATYLDRAGNAHEAEVVLYRIQNGGHNWPGDHASWPDFATPVNYDPSFRVSAVGFPVICVGPARRDQLWGVGG